ncbi:hypothetical protein KC19_1G092800 [Ceratodon purpureus]|uniref:Uncharacterized protein n=1 Tax=Ceratodon purpureus TaxID=3225 RepID=A0A8T0J489_CERPU|nr:hypothetical protein KC19_1G092800 [Ceratodon purpureus]
MLSKEYMGRIWSLALAVLRHILRSAAVLPVPSSKYLSCGRFGCCFKTGVATGLCQGCWPGDCIGIDKLTFVTLIGVQILLNLQVAVNFIYL